MKKRILILFAIILTIKFNLSAQYLERQRLISYGLAFASGVANGYNETITHHYPQFKKHHPHANDQFYDPKISWLNKYKNYPVNTSSRYFGSKTILVWTTDAYHLTNTLDRTLMLGASINITIGRKQKWYYYLLDAVCLTTAKSAGFHTVYSLIYK